MIADGTRVLLTYVADQLNVWLRFGHPRAELILDERRRLVELPAHALCCRVRWRADRAHGTVEWQLMVLQTCAPGEVAQRVVGIAPGASVLLTITGQRKVLVTLALIDQMEAAGIDPAHTAPEYWRVVHQRLCVRGTPPSYTPARHDAYLRREVGL